jgi:CRP-like cAMP-binding protein
MACRRCEYWLLPPSLKGADMKSNKAPVAEPFVRRLTSVIRLAQSEQQAILDLPVRLAEIKPDQEIVREGDRPLRMFFIIEGMTCTYKLTAEGRRQIVMFHMSGDAPDLQSVHLTTLDVSIATITPATVGFVEHEHILRLCEQYPRVAAGFWRHTLIDAAIFREWMTSIGQRQAPSRIAHLLCELYLRADAVGLADQGRMAFPITQLEIADALGLSSVHVNRSIQELRRKQLVLLGDSTLQILDWRGLQRAGDFNPNYLHMKEQERRD